MKITLIAGTRPNFVKISPIIDAISMKAIEGTIISYRLVHTGQHYDKAMSKSFFVDLGIPEPHVNLEVGSGTQAEQTAAIMVRFEKELIEHPADCVLVVGDVTSTMACAIVAKKQNTLLVHVEGGIRSFDNSMPEEINRRVTDSITDHFFTTSSFANENLKNEGISEDRIHFVGNVMIDTLTKNVANLRAPQFFEAQGLGQKKYLVLTLHRPANVDNPDTLRKILSVIGDYSNDSPIVFPVHPRTKKVMLENNILIDKLILVEPLPYLEFNYLVKNAFGVITDSGGITEETTVMGIPCMTLRDNTERPETCTIGTNELLGTKPENLRHALEHLFKGKWKKGAIPDLWDGKSAVRIIDKLIELIPKK